MPKLDKVIDFMRQKRGKRFVMRSNDSCLLFTDQGRQPLNRVMSAAEVETMVREVLPIPLTDRFDKSSHLAFPYKYDKTEFTVNITRQNGKLEVTLGLPGEGSGEPAKPPPARKAPAKSPPAAPKPVSAAVSKTPVAETAPLPASPPATAGSPVPVAAAPASAPLAPVAFIAPAAVAAPAAAPAPTPLVYERVSYPADFMSLLIRHARNVNASDLHLHCGIPPRLRVHGIVEEYAFGEQLDSAQMQCALLDFLPTERQQEWLATGRARFCVDFDESTRLRCTIYQDRAGLVAAIRLLPGEPPAIEALGLPAITSVLARLESGLVVIAGPPTSGRSTTLAALLNTIGASRHVHIVTVEEPIEFVYSHHRSVYTQLEAPTHCKSIAEALHGIPLLNADVCAVADLGEEGTIRQACRLAESGLLVIGVMSVHDVVGLLEKLVEVLTETDEPRACRRIARMLRGAICQFLCPRADGEGLAPVFESLLTNAAVQSLICDHKFADVRGMMAGGEEGMLTFNECLLQRVQAKAIAIEEARARSTDLVELRRIFSRAGLSV